MSKKRVIIKKTIKKTAKSKAISNKKNKSVSAEEAFKTMQVIEAVRLSSKSGTRIKLPL